MSVLGIHKYVQQNWVAKLGAAGLSYWPYEAVALSRFVRACEGAGLWNKLIAVYPLCGRTAAASCYKLKKHTLDTVDAMPLLTGAYPESSYSPRTGMTANGGFSLDTGFVCSTMLAAGAWGAANASVMFAMDIVYQSKVQGFMFGVDDPPGARLSYLIDTAGALFIAADPLHVAAGSGNYDGGAPMNAATGSWIINRTSNTAFNIYKNGALYQTGSSANNSAHALPALPVYLGGWNNDGANLPAPAGDRFLFAAIGQGFSDAECATFYGIRKILMEDLRRAIQVNLIS